MDWKKNRLWIAGGALVVLAALAVWIVQSKSSETAAADGSGTEDALPDVDKSDITELEIRRPEADPVKLRRVEGAWRVVEPVDAVADETAVTTALEKLDELEVTGVAATLAANHERLEVDAAHAVRVIARKGSEVVADLLVGAYRGGNTMVRAEDQQQVYAVRGSIKYAFNKEVKEWRDRKVTDESADDVREVTFESANGTWRFVRNGDEWQPAEGQAAIERFSPAKVRSSLASLARMRASDFAAANVTPEAAGFGTPKATVTMVVERGGSQNAEGEEGEEGQQQQPPAERRTIVLRLGNALEGDREFYLRREGSDVTYVVSSFLAERMQPNAEAFQAPEPGSEPPAAAAGGDPHAGMPGMPGMPPGGPGGPGGGGQIPPEVMRQIQEQLAKQRPN